MQPVSALVARLVNGEGSSRPAGLLRIALALLAWSCWGVELTAFAARAPWEKLLALNFWPSTTLLLFGVYSRFAALWAGLTLMFAYHYGGLVLGDQDAWLHHHEYILSIGVLLLALTPCGRSFSVDRWRAPELPERGPTWGMTLIGFQLCCVYFWGAFDKTNLAWLSGDRLEQILRFFYFGSDPIPAWHHAAFMVGTCVAVALEYALAFGLFVPRARRVLVPLGMVMHAGFYVILSVSTFSCTCVAMYLAFLDPDAVHAAIDRLLGVQASDKDTRASL